MKQVAFIFTLLISASSFAQGPPHSPKLEKENGFNQLKIGALFSNVKSVLQKDTLNRKTSFEPKAQTVSYTDRIYLVDLKKPGYSQFCGKNIARIEVWFYKHYDQEGEGTGDFEISEVKIFLKKISGPDTDNFFSKLMELYGNSSISVDVPEKGDEILTWYSPMVMMYATSFYGDMASEQLKRDYFEIHFESALGG